jgi:short subunit dehydrogenase-like uncharacterized protein
MIYGAYGFSGALIVREAVARGHQPLLAGRNRAKITAIADEIGLDFRVLEVDDERALAAAVAEFDLVLNTAGPFTSTSRPMIQACLEGRAHYLDISGELYVLEDTFAFDPLAKKAGTALIPGVGFDVVPSDCLARTVSEGLPSAVELEIAIAALGQPSAGTIRTSMEIFSRGGVLRKNGVLEPYEYGRGAKEIRFSNGKKWTTIPVPWADLVTAFRTTNIPNITIYFAVQPRLIKFMKRGGSLAQWLLSSEAVRKASKGLVKYFIKEPGEGGRREEKSYLWARVKDRQGSQNEAWMETVESYQFTAAAAVRCVEETFSRDLTGALTPAQAFGADFVLGIEGTRRLESLPVHDNGSS